MRKTILLATMATLVMSGATAQLGGLIRKTKDKTTSSNTEKETKTETPASAPQQTTETKATPAQQAQQKEKTAPPPVERMLLWPEGNRNRIQSDPPASPLHDKYVGKLVFSSQQLTPEATKETMFKNSFAIDEPIYARVYLAHAVPNYVLYGDKGKGTYPWENNDGECSLKYTVDGKDTVYILKNFVRKSNSRTWTSWQYFISARGENAEFNEPRFVNHMNSLADGEHTIRFQLWAGGIIDRWSIQPIATGEITINKMPGKKMNLYRNWNFYKAGMSNPAIEKEMVEVMKQKAAHDGWKETFSKAKIIDKDWYVAKSEFSGLVLYRTINALVFAKWPDGHCTVQEFNFKQEWNGNAWSKVLEFNGIGDQTTIDCD